MTKNTQNIKYQDIFRTAKDLFWKYGIKRVTIEEICREAGVSKMTFYKFFPNKIELAKTVINVVIGKSLEKYEELVKSSMSFPKKIEAIFLLKLEASKDVSIEFINDIHKNVVLELKELLEEQQQKSLKILIDFLVDSQSKGLIRKDIKIEFVLSYINQMSQMINDDKLLAKYNHPQDLIMESMKFFFYGLLSKR